MAKAEKPESRLENEYLLADIIKAEKALRKIANHIPLERNDVLSERYGCNIYFKREDKQTVRSFKIRGAYNKMQSLTPEELERGVVCASAGNHAQGVAFSCKALKCQGKIFMPTSTPKQKITQVKRFGEDYIEVILTGDTFDDSFNAAMEYCTAHDMCFVHPFDDIKVIAGQGSIGFEIMNDDLPTIDYIFVTIGGGGLASGISAYIKSISPDTKVIGCEPLGAASMKAALDAGHVVELETIDKFVDGAAVKKVGDLTFEICKRNLDDVIAVPEGKVCSSILQLYNDSAIVLEPAGALPLATLDFYKDQIKGKNVVCVLSGSNNDITRMQEMKERSMIYEGLMHYFIIDFPQNPGAFKEFTTDVVGPNDDITRFEYTKRNNKKHAPTIVGIELSKAEDYEPLIQRLNSKGLKYTVVEQDSQLFDVLIYAYK